MVKVCIHHPVNPEKANLCVRLQAHEPKDTTDLVLPFSDDPDQLSLALDNMVKDRIISANGRREIRYQIEQGIRDRVEAARRIELTHPIWIPPAPPVAQDNGLNLNDPRIKEIVITYKD